jgi:hypothetical protein
MQTSFTTTYQVGKKTGAVGAFSLLKLYQTLKSDVGGYFELPNWSKTRALFLSCPFRAAIKDGDTHWLARKLLSTTN